MSALGLPDLSIARVREIRAGDFHYPIPRFCVVFGEFGRVFLWQFPDLSRAT